MIPTQRSAALISVLVLLLSATVYLLTLTPTVPFWDSGEYIAVSQILGIPHPPGTPFYVLLGRIFALVPIASIAQRVNAMSAIAAAFAVFFTYLTTLRLIRIAQGGERQVWHEWVAVISSVVGALMLAFSDVWWENSVEAEVYQLMSLAQILVFWLGLKWWESHGKKPTVGPLLVATYVMWLCVGLHLGVGIMGLPLLVLVFLVDKPVAFLFMMPFLSLVRVPAGFEKMLGTVILLSIVTSFVMVWRRKLNGWVAVGGALLALKGLSASFTDANFDAATGIMTVLAVLGPIVWLALTQREGRVLLLALFLMVAGYSTHLYLPIRAAQQPAVNEGAPATWDKLRDLLERKQYGEMNPLVRRAPLMVQLDKEFWRYFSRQWPLFPSDRLWAALLPILLGLAGGYWQFRKDRKSFAYTFAFLGLSTAGMIVFLNFSAKEVRDRDYFFQSGFHAYSIWIGLGVAFLVQWVRESFEDVKAQRLATITATGLLATQPFLLLANHWHSHDRSGNYIARDYAYNMLATLKPNSFMFTNGDNDTFPLWYIQQVEGFRKDVRIVNLSLLNTDWYIRQLRDEEPKVPIQLDDRTVDMLGAGAFQDEQGNITYTNEFMVRHILEQTKRDSGWVKTPYFAVTVPQDFGYGNLFRQEGIVQEVMRDSLQAGMDAEATHKALYETYKYRGLLTADGSWDPKVYKDDNAQNLSKNYAFAHMQLALYYRRLRDFPKAIAEMERVQRMFPDWVEIQVPLGGIYLAAGDTAKAWSFYDKLVKQVPNSAEAHYYRGASLGYRGDPQGAIEEFKISMRLDPNYGYPYYDLFATLWETGQREEAVSVLERWVALHPDDQEGAARLQEARSRLTPQGSGGAPLGVPPSQRPR
ncbi:MAG: DUF2723 domain-containing protein [Candidatus Eisenbacteria bacterium]|nr:DUF2723 domain-containing protein [Candidatus Eisenbacteria bacterium]